MLRAANDTTKTCICGKSTDPIKGNCVGCKRPPGECVCKQMVPTSMYTRAQWSQQLIARYGKKWDTDNITEYCVKQGLLKDAGGGQYLTHYDKQDIFSVLEGNNNLLKQAALSNPNNRVVTSSRETYAQTIRYSKMNDTPFIQRTAALNNDQLREIPSYAFCIDPSLKLALQNAKMRVESAVESRVLDTNTANQWKTAIENVKNAREVDQILTSINSYLGGLRFAEVDDANKRIREINECTSPDELKKHLYDKSPKVKLALVGKLKNFGKTEYLLRLVEDASEYVVDAALDALVDLEDLEGLKSLIDHSNAIVRTKVRKAIGEIDSKYYSSK